ncbi:HAD hydrolase-like protein [Rothia uropygioeca]|uniref:HAD hydrolase-like protein n=1 Tax=Kocuria sp. 257 TaxID=2021970 RepID=UPI001013782E|nr:HAD hydrolase-like protein [Kocuria sp. 257]
MSYRAAPGTTFSRRAATGALIRGRWTLGRGRSRRQGKRLMVVTAASRDVVVPALGQADLLTELDGVVALEDVEAPQPHPEAYLTALEQLRLPPVASSRIRGFADWHHRRAGRGNNADRRHRQP